MSGDIRTFYFRQIIIIIKLTKFDEFLCPSIFLGFCGLRPKIKWDIAIYNSQSSIVTVLYKNDSHRVKFWLQGSTKFGCLLH